MSPFHDDRWTGSHRLPDVSGLPAVPTFDDTQDWYVAPGQQADANGWTGVDVPKTGTRITVMSTGAQDTFVQVRVN